VRRTGAIGVGDVGETCAERVGGSIIDRGTFWARFRGPNRCLGHFARFGEASDGMIPDAE
jgi:hypothetical protein